MKLLNHIKLTGFIGLIVGLLFGIVDIISKIIATNFEWYEFYQTLVISSLIFVLAFIILTLFVQLFIKITKLDITKKNLLVFYTISAISLILLFYAEVFVVKFFLARFIIDLYHPIIPKISFIIACIVGLIYILLLIKGSELTYKIILFARNNLKNFIKNFFFFLIIFIIISFFIDLYLLNTPNPESNKKLEYPNILFIILDTVRADHLSLYNYHLNTSPNLDKFAEDAVVFENAISPSSWTLPVIGSLFTGKYPSHHNAVKRHQKLENKEITLAEILEKKGYNTAGFISYQFLKKSYGFGQGFITYKDRMDFFSITGYDKLGVRTIINYFFPINKFFNSDRKKGIEEINKDVFEWFNKNKDSTFFMFIHYYTYLAHNDKFRKQFTNETRDYNEIKKNRHIKRYENISKDILDYMIALYDADISYTDYHLGKLLKKLDELNIKDNTIIIITSDHGEEFYEHGGFSHLNTLYEEMIHVPLIIYYPKEFKQKKIDKRIGIINIFPTILDILQIKIPEDIDSVSLLSLIKNNDYNKDYVFSEILGRFNLDETEQRALSYKNWKLIEVTPETETLPSSLFNLETDPKEQENLYDKEIEKRKELQEYIASIIKEIN